MRSLHEMASITCVIYLLIACPALLKGAVELESEVCHGIDEFDRQYYDVTCKTSQSTDLIAFRTLSYGYKADATCRPHAVREDCCHYEVGDCVFETNDHMEDLLTYCAGAHSCQKRSHREPAVGRCPIINDPIPYTLFGKVTYECINVGLLVDVCDNHIETNNELYLAREIYYKTPVAVNSKCNCVITTACHTKVKLEAIAVNLVEQDGDCSKYLSMQDFYGGNETIITCADGYLHSFSTIFTSSGYGVRLALFNESSHDHIWIKASAEDSEEQVSIHCGTAVNLPTNHEIQCQTTRETTTTTYETTHTTELSTRNEASTIYVHDTTEKVSSTTETSAELQGGSQMWYGWGIIGGIVTGVVLAFIIIFIFILVWRRRKRSTETGAEPFYNDPMFHYSASSQNMQEGIVVAENQMYQNMNSSNLEQDQISGQVSTDKDLAMKNSLPAAATGYNNYVKLSPENEVTHPQDYQPYENVTPEVTFNQWQYNNAYAGDEPVVDKAALYNMNDSADEHMDDKQSNMDADDDD